MSITPKGSIPDAEYLLQRATAELAKAESESGLASEAHQKLASCYLGVLFGGSAEASLYSRHPKDPQREPIEWVFSQLAESWASNPQTDHSAELSEILNKL